MSIAEAVLLGFIQGLTEFLPVSSSGHLVLAGHFLGVKKTGIAFEVFLHFGTLMAIVTVFRRMIWEIIISCVGGTEAFLRGDTERRRAHHRGLRLALWIVVGSIPAAVFGILFKNSVEEAFSNPTLVSICLIATGLILWSTRFFTLADRTIGGGNALLIGLAQALAILPGISRSGATISTALIRGINGEEAVTFSFLLAIPAILGATLLEVVHLLSHAPSHSELSTWIFGAVAAYISGYFAITLLLNTVRRGKLDYFSYYCWGVGLSGLILRGAF